MAYESNYLRRIVTVIVGDTTTIISDDVENASFLIIIRKTDGVDKKTWGYVTSGQNVSYLKQFLSDNGVTLTSTIESFINQCASYQGARVIVDTKTFEGDKSQLCWGVTFRNAEDIFFRDRWNYSPHINDDNVPIRGGIKFVYDLNQDKFVTLKVYEGTDYEGTENPNVVFNIADDDSLTIVDNQLCSHRFIPADATTLDNLSEIPSMYKERFPTEIQQVLSLRTEALEDSGIMMSFKVAERQSRNQGYLYASFFRRKIRKQPLFPPLS